MCADSVYVFTETGTGECSFNFGVAKFSHQRRLLYQLKLSLILLDLTYLTQSLGDVHCCALHLLREGSPETDGLEFDGLAMRVLSSKDQGK